MTDASRDTVAPPKFLPCPRCGAATFTRQDVRLHDTEHAKQDTRDRRLDVLMTRLEGFLDAADSIEADDDGGTMTFAEWIDYVGTALDELRTRPTPGAGFTLEAGEWPGTTESTPDADDPYDPSDFPPQPTAAEEAADDDDDADAVDMPAFPASRF